MLAKVRPDDGDAKNMALIAECFKTIKPQHFVVIFNKANKKFTAEKAITYFNKSCHDAGVEDFITLKEDQITLVRDHTDDIDEEGEEFENEVADKCGPQVAKFIK